MRVSGRCHCGEIEYHAIVNPEQVGVCHCSDCQSLTGSAWRVTVPALASVFELRKGEPRRYVKTADSGARRVHAFCGDCGSPVYSCAEEKPQSYTLRVGCLAQRALLHPRRQQWCDSALRWSGDLTKLPKLERQ